MNITAVKSIVEHIKSNNSINEYAGQESLTIVRCEVNTSDGITGVGITGRFFASDVSNFINHHISHNLSGKDPLDIELITTLLIKKFNPRNWNSKKNYLLNALELSKNDNEKLFVQSIINKYEKWKSNLILNKSQMILLKQITHKEWKWRTWY